MESDLQQASSSSGLTRYRSAPSSYFSNIIDREFYEHILDGPSSPETERVFSRFMNSIRDDGALVEDSSLAPNFSAVKEEENMSQQDQGMTSSINNNNSNNNNNEQVVLHQQQNSMNSYTSLSHGFNYQNTARPPLPNQNLSSAVEGRFLKTGGGANHSTLARHNSSPAGLFSQINIENGYVSMRGVGTLGAVNNTIEEAKFSTRRRLKNNPQSYASRGLMSSIAEIGDKDNREENQDSGAFGENNEYVTDFPPWDDSVVMNDNVAGLKRFTSDDARPFSSGLNAAEAKNETRGQAPAPLVSHLSLPNTSAEMAAIEKFLQFSDSVPCKIRAKRGCATHPRSIAERVRRTKISERMRKLQDLVPNMDKQTNTADMLDLAVDYIKDLQKQVQTLSDCHAKCTCSPNPQQ